MKNQNDIIFTIVAAVLGLVVVIVSFATQPSVTKPADPNQVNVAPAQPPAGDVVYANSLPNAGAAGAGGGGGMGAAAGPGSMSSGKAAFMGNLAGGGFAGNSMSGSAGPRRGGMAGG